MKIDLNGRLITGIAVSEKNNSELLECSQNYEKEVNAEVIKMYTDKDFYNEKGGWANFYKDTNKKNLRKFFKSIANQYKLDSVDFENDGTLFITVRQ